MAKKKPTKRGQVTWLLGRISGSERRRAELEPGLTTADRRPMKLAQRHVRDVCLAMLSPEPEDPRRES